MKIVVFGDQQRVGAWIGEQIIDLNRGYASLLHQRSTASSQEQADTRVRATLLAFSA